ncbi:hypothetical protein OR1_03845 [Geobacter sp. OR-1]|uniref:radical SAM protein n=1 Tax=Geobacter sp. OR-1 TaxID=1266765 RepID=UPI000542A3C8|nr:radical SAM protein [Geobacter sp. OR-1]GAM11529.1 hypothetical protein OR1_03845 [Geobacter sp. OR-1]
MNFKPAKVVWAGMPGSACNLNCKYCYSGSAKGERGKFRFPLEHMLRSFAPDRFGGPIFFGGAAAGETLLVEGIVDFTRGMLELGHVVSYTTNMTYSPVIDEFCKFPDAMKKRLQLDASLHYLELKEVGKLNTYFDNLRKLKDEGISIALFLCITEEYLPHLNEIHDLCMQRIGLLPVAGMTRVYSSAGGKNSGSLLPEYEELVMKFCDHRQWDLQKKVYGQKRNEFCRAGEVSINLSLETGEYTKCWGSSGRMALWEQLPFSGALRSIRRLPGIGRVAKRIIPLKSQVMGNLYDLEQPIDFKPMGQCPFYDCVCASYLCWGLIPGFDAPTHSRTYFQPEYVSKEIFEFMDCHLVSK